MLRPVAGLSDARIGRLRDAYLEPFEALASPRQLRPASLVAQKLGIVTRAACWYRVVKLSRAPDIGLETLAYWLRQLPRAFR